MVNLVETTRSASNAGCRTTAVPVGALFAATVITFIATGRLKELPLPNEALLRDSSGKPSAMPIRDVCECPDRAVWGSKVGAMVDQFWFRSITECSLSDPNFVKDCDRVIQECVTVAIHLAPPLCGAQFDAKQAMERNKSELNQFARELTGDYCKEIGVSGARANRAKALYERTLTQYPCSKSGNHKPRSKGR